MDAELVARYMAFPEKEKRLINAVISSQASHAVFGEKGQSHEARNEARKMMTTASKEWLLDFQTGLLEGMPNAA